MSSVSTPHGFRPVGLLGGRVYAGATRKFQIASGYGTGIFYGDAVKLVAAGTIEKDTGTTAMTPVGIFLGCEYIDPNVNQKVFKQYFPASTTVTTGTITAFVADDPDLVMRIQADEAVDQTDVGANFAIVQGAGSTVTGNSGVSLDGGSHNTTNTLPVRLIGFVDGPDSAVSDAYTDCLVKWNVGHQYNNTQGV